MFLYPTQSSNPTQAVTEERLKWLHYILELYFNER